MDRYRIVHSRVLILPFMCVALAATAARAVAQPDITALDRTMATAEEALRQGELQIAESRYRSALMEGWMVMGGIDAADRRLGEARGAFRRASTAVVDATEALRWLAFVELQDGKPGEAATILARLTGPQAASISIMTVDDSRLAPFAAMSPAQRTEARHRVSSALARAYLNLGIMQAQAGRFVRAAELFEEAAGVDAAFPQVQYSLGVAYFNAQRYDKAAAPLARVLDADPGQAIVRRMLAVASLHTGAYDKAAALLADDPQRATDPSLQYAYGVALVRSGRAADAEAIFSRLLAEHADTPELSVVLGHAYAQQGNFDAAIEALRRALQLKPDVADANSALGVIYLKQGKLAEAEAALRAELTAHPDDTKARHTLATVLDLAARPDEALAQARLVVKATPEVADARYLLGKILLARGAADEAAEHLEAAARLAPEDANIHYQLAQAYRKLGRTEAAQKEFDTYQQIKDKHRGKPR